MSNVRGLETIDYGPCAFTDDYHPDTGLFLASTR